MKKTSRGTTEKNAKGTQTSSFGVSKRESHDATPFYERFTPPEISSDTTMNECAVKDEVICGDSRSMKELADNCVALVVTSPPYFAGKDYEKELGKEGAPSTYIEYLEMLRGVFKECKRVLEPGGRIAVNVANLGRKPYRSLSADVIGILQDDLRFLLRGEIIWRKAKGASGNCAWGSYRSASNPVLRDTTERVIVASKGSLARALPRPKRRQLDLPCEDSILPEEFMSATLDVWEIQPESAKRVGHPAPFPVELPRRLIELYTYKGDVILDPFMGAGTTCMAALVTDRHYVGYELETAYVDLARKRIEEKRRNLSSRQLRLINEEVEEEPIP